MNRNIFRHWPALMVSTLIALSIVLVGTVFYVRSRDVMQQEIRHRLSSIAGAASIHINGDLLDSINDPKDMERTEYKEVIALLQEIRNLPGIRYAYILRKTDDPSQLAFVADADTALSPKQLDDNGNGLVESSEEPGYPGELYDISAYPQLQGPAFIAPTADKDITYDRWGAIVSGYAPIRRQSNGQINAVLGIDMDAKEFTRLSHGVFSPLILLLIFIGALFTAGLSAFYAEHRQVSMLKKINGERSGLLHLTFHQLGEPLTIMKWSLETLREETESPELKMLVDEHVICMDEGLGRLNSIIDTLQLAEKVELNTIEYVPVPSSMRALADNAVEEWKSSLQKRKQTIDVQIDSGLTLPLDTTLLSLVFRQLLMNAIEYSPEGSTIRLRAQMRRKDVLVQIEDQGCGIPKADLNRLFEKYRRGSNAHLQKPDGNGLGLYITKGIVEKAGGRIWLESIEGRGTTVSFTLPN